MSKILLLYNYIRIFVIKLLIFYLDFKNKKYYLKNRLIDMDEEI